MAHLVEDRTVHRLTQAEVTELARVSDELYGVELLGGVLVDRVNPGPEHATLQARLNMWLARGVDPSRCEVRVEAPLGVLDRFSLPQPDLMVCGTGAVSDHPAEAALVIEVAVSTLRSDRNVKAPLYGASGIPEYWIVDVNACRLLVFTDPIADGYANLRVLTRADTARPTAVDIEPLPLETLFAGL